MLGGVGASMSNCHDFPSVEPPSQNGLTGLLRFESEIDAGPCDTATLKLRVWAALAQRFSIRGIPTLLFSAASCEQQIAGITGKKAIVESTRSARCDEANLVNCGEQFPKKPT